MSKQIRSAAVLLISAVVTNAVLSLFLKKQVSYGWWVARGLLLLAAASALSCKADWQDIKAGSRIVRVFYGLRKRRVTKDILQRERGC